MIEKIIIPFLLEKPSGKFRNFDTPHPKPIGHNDPLFLRILPSHYLFDQNPQFAKSIQTVFRSSRENHRYHNETLSS